MVVQAALGRDKMHGVTGICDFGTQVVGNGAGVIHDLIGSLENIFIDPLEDIFLAGVHHNFESCIDMAVAQFAAGNGIAINLKGVCKFLCLQNSHL